MGDIQSKVIRVWTWIPILGIYPAMFKMEYVEKDWPLTVEGMLNAVYQMGCVACLIAKAYS